MSKKHLCFVTVESDGEMTTLTIKCEQCEGGVYRFATPHIETLARILPKVCKLAGIDLSQGVSEEHVFDLATPENRQKAEGLFQDFLRRRKARDN